MPSKLDIETIEIVACESRLNPTSHHLLLVQSAANYSDHINDNQYLYTTQLPTFPILVATRPVHNKHHVHQYVSINSMNQVLTLTIFTKFN